MELCYSGQLRDKQRVLLSSSLILGMFGILQRTPNQEVSSIQGTRIEGVPLQKKIPNNMLHTLQPPQKYTTLGINTTQITELITDSLSSRAM